MLGKIRLSKKHMLMLVLPFILIFAVFFFKAFFVQNIIDYINFNYLSKYSVTDEYVRFLSLNFPKEKKINISEIASLIPVKQLETATITAKREMKKEKDIKEKSHKLTFIYIGTEKKFAEIDGNLFLEGDYISQGEKLVRIEKDRVLIDILGRKKWLYILN